MRVPRAELQVARMGSCIWVWGTWAWGLRYIGLSASGEKEYRERERE